MFKAGNEKLTDLLNEAESHKLQIPDFQRGWVWDTDRIRSLLASLTMGYPIGVVMLLEAGDDIRFNCRYIGDDHGGVQPERMVLDGQQRLTSMYLAMCRKQPVPTHELYDKNKIVKKYYYLDIGKALNTTTDRTDAIVVVDDKKQIRKNIGRDIVLDLSTQEKEFENKMIPFNRLSSSFEIDEWRDGYQDYYDFNSDIIKQYQTINRQIIQPLLDYDVPVINVLKDAPKEAVCQVFENVNRGGVPLTVFELLTAMFAADGYRLRDVWQNYIKKTLQESEVLNVVDEVALMTSMTLLVTMRNGKTVSAKKRDVLNLAKDDFVENLDDLLEGYRKANKLMTEMAIYSRRDVPYSTQLIPLSTICAVLGKDFENANVKAKLKQWFWCGVFGELYGGANETRYALDVQQVPDWCLGKSEDVPKTVNDCNFRTTRLVELHTKNSAAYKGVNAIILNNKARDWVNGAEMVVSNYLDERSDIHHIFPKDYCIKHQLDQRIWDSVINKTPIFASTNRYIGGVAPSEYSQKIVKNKHINDDELRSFQASHLIDVTCLRNDDFNGFIIARAKKLLDGIERFTGKPIVDRGSDEVVSMFGEDLK